MLAMQQLPSSIPFAWAWWASDLGDARPCDGTYCQYPYEDLPPIPTLDGALSWLGQPGWVESPDVTPDRRESWERYTAEARKQVRDLATQAERLGVRLPPAFMHLMAAPELHARIPEYTGCWFNLYDAQLDPCPGSQDGFVVRSMRRVITWNG
jgi:hypothetical protein